MGLLDSIGYLANMLTDVGEKLTFSEANEVLGNPRNSSRAIAGDISRSYDYHIDIGDFRTANDIATSFTNKNGDWAWLEKEGFTKK